MLTRFVLAAVICCMCLLPAAPAARAQTTQAAPAAKVDLADKAAELKAYPACPLCGMDREKFAHSRMLVEYEDGTVFAACSLHCAVLDMAVNLDKAPARTLVGDLGTKDLIDAEKATWVIGGDQMGVMTKRAKWAFADKAAAEAFAAAHGGQTADFDAALKAAFEDMAADTMMIRDKRKARRMQQQQQKAQ